jgi:hypothetical protein
MSIPIVAFLTVVAVFFCPSLSPAQQAEAPTYKDGDWWRVKVDIVRPTGVSVSGPQLGGFPEYLVRFENGNAKVTGARGEEMKEVEGSGIIPLVLGKSGWRGELLRFPLRVGVKWSDRFQHQPRGLPVQWAEGQYEVQAWEKIKIPKGEFDAFKIVLTSSVAGGPKAKGRPLQLNCAYFYAPVIKAIVSLNEVLPDASVTSTVVDFKLGS